MPTTAPDTGDEKPVLDRIERAHFRTTPDGVVVFFPWKATDQGYVLSDPSQKKRFKRAVQLVYGVALFSSLLVFAIEQDGMNAPDVSFLDFLRILAISIAPAVACITLYAVWIHRAVEALPRSDFRVSQDELLVEAARELEPRVARNGLIAGIVLVAAGVAVAFIEPRMAWLAGVLIVMLAAGVAMWRRMQRAVEASRH